MPNSPSISAIVVTIDRTEATRACIESLLVDGGEGLLEVIVVLNGATDEVAAMVAATAERDDRLVPVVIDRASASAVRNRGVELSRGAVLYFLDDDVIVAPGAVDAVARCFAEHPEVDIVGGPNLTPADDPPFARLSGALLATAWGTGVTRARYGARDEGPADERHLILCNLAMRRELFSERGLTFPALFGGEENALMGEAAHRGVSAWYAPDVLVHHRRRKTLLSYCEQIHRYGWGRVNAIARAPGTARPTYFVPVFFLAYLLSLPVIAPLSPWALLPAVAYGAGTLGASIALAMRHREPTWGLYALALYPLTHVVYAAGIVRQALRFLFFPSLRAALRGEVS